MKRIHLHILLLSFLVLFNILINGCTTPQEQEPEDIKQSKNSNQPDTKLKLGESERNEQTNQTKDTKLDTDKKIKALKPGDFFPLYADLSWEYHGEGNEYASFSRKVLFNKDNLAQIREDNGGTVSASVFKTTNDAVTRVFFVGEAYDQSSYLNSEPNENIIILKEPLKAGTKWNEATGVREIVDVNATVDTPAGSFERCIKVKISDKNSIVNEYFKQGIGMVKREFISGEFLITSSLKEFKQPER